MTVKTPSKPGRKPLAPITQLGPEFVHATPPAIAADQAVQNQMIDGYGAERDLVNQLLGQTQMASAIARFSLTLGTSKLAHVKESKAYKSLRGMKSPKSGILTGTWEEYCNLLGRSVAHVDEDIANLRAFGKEALENLSRMGIGYRDLRKLRALPEDGQKALIAIAESGDKEQLLELAEDLIAREEVQKKKLADERDRAVNQYEAREKVVKATQEQLTSLKEKLARIPREKPDEKGKAMIIEVGGFAIGAATELKQLVTGVETLLQHGVEHPAGAANYKAAVEHHLGVVIEQVGELVSLLELAGLSTLPDRLRIALGEE